MIRTILGRNLAQLRDAKWRTVAPETERNKKLGGLMGSSLSQVQRLIAGKVGTSIDTLEQLADIFGVTPADLVTPYTAAKATSSLRAHGGRGKGELYAVHETRRPASHAK